MCIVKILKGLFTLIVVGILLAALTYFVGKPLLSDWQMKDNYQVAQAGRLDDGSCKVKYGLFVLCDISIESQLPTETVSKTGYYFFVDFGGGDYSVRVIEDKPNPTNISAQFAQDKLINRLISFVVVFGLFFLGIIGALKILFGRAPA